MTSLKNLPCMVSEYEASKMNSIKLIIVLYHPARTDWDESETISAAISSSTTKANNNAAPSLTMAGSGSSTATTSASGPGCTNATGGPADHLWEDNWDDDDTEDEWSKRLREHLAS